MLTRKQFKKKFPNGNYARYRAKMSAGKKKQTYPGLPSSLQPLTQKQMLALAQKLAAAQTGPAVSQIEQERQRAQELAARQQAAISGFSQASQGLLAGIGPQISSVYQDAAAAQAAAAQGFSGDLRTLAGQNAADAAALMAQHGAPQGQIDQVAGQVGDSGAGDVLYGLGGYIPSSTLGREGAGWAAAAGQMPAVAARQGQQELAGLAVETAATDREFARALQQLAAQRGGSIAEIMQGLSSQEREKLAMRLAMQELGMKADNQAWQQQMDVAGLQADAAGSAAKAAGERADSKAKKAQEKNKAKIAFKKAVEAQALKLIEKGGRTLNPDYDPQLGSFGPPEYIVTGESRPSLSQASTTIQAALREEIRQLGRLYGMTPMAIRRLIREVLLGNGWSRPPKTPANSFVGPPGAGFS